MSAFRLACVAAGTTSLLAMAPAAFAAPTPAPGWSSSTQDITTGVLQGYELAIDPLNRRLYAADARAAQYERHFLPNAGGSGFSNDYYDVTVQPNAGKVVQFDLDTNAYLKNFLFTSIFGADGTTPGGAYSLPTTPPTTGAGATTGIATANTTQTANNPYGVAVDVSTTNADGAPDPTIVTVQTRTSSVAIFKQSQAAPTNADILPASATGLVRARTPVVDSTRNKAYVVGYNATGGVVVQINTKTKAVEATIPVPAAVGIAIDTDNNLLYAGTFNATDATSPGNDDVVRVVDLNQINTSQPLVKANNAGAVVAVIKGVGLNARPGFDAVGKKLYTANSSKRTISVVDLDPASANYRKVVKTLDATGSPNSIAVDTERRLVYSADLGSRVLSVIDAKTDTWVAGIPTTGSALDVDVDPETGTAYVSSLQNGTTTGVAQVQAVNVARPASLPKGDTGAPGAPGGAGAPGAPGAPGAVGPVGPAGSSVGELSIALSSLKLVGTKVTVDAPAAGAFAASLTSGGRTIASGKKTATKAGKVSFNLKQTAYGKTKLKGKKAIKGTLTVKFTPSATQAKRTTKAVKATLKVKR